jgi:hypothetical protein
MESTIAQEARQNLARRYYSIWLKLVLKYT